MFTENSIPEINSGHQTFVNLVEPSHLNTNPALNLSSGIEVDYFEQNYLETTFLKTGELEGTSQSDILTGIEPADPLVVSQPDLTITKVSLSNTLVAGNTLKFTYGVSNTGSAGATASQTKFYLSSDTLLNGNDTLLGDDSVTSLAAGKSLLEADIITFSNSLTPGSYYFLAAADSGNSNVESNESNNLFAQQLQITNLDLTIDSFTLTSPGLLTAGQTITFNYTIKNQGTTANTVSSKTKYYLSTDLTWDENDPYLGDDKVNPLAVGASLTRTDSVVLSSTLNTGTYYLLTQVDATGIVSESNENNNLNAKKVDIQGAPDLTLTSLSSPTTAISGEGVKFDYTLQNLGLSSSGTSLTRFYLSTNQTYESSDLLIGSDSVASIAAGSSVARTPTFTINTSIKEGSYYLIAMADGGRTIKERNEDNNIFYPLGTFEILKSDLEISQFSLTAPNPLTAGNVVNVNYTIANIGKATAKASVTKYYLSTNETYETGDIYLGDDSIVAMSPGTSLNRTDSFTLDTSLESDNYYFLAIADSTKAVAESNENNNLDYYTIEGSSQNQPDLIIDPLAGSLVVNRGSNLDLTYTIENQGGDVAQTSTTKFYLSTDTSLNGNDLALGSDAVGTLDSGVTSTEGVTLATNSLNAGTYYVLAQADGENTVTESDETNNIIYQTVEVVETAKPDLLFDKLTIAPAVTRGSNLSATYTVRNQGYTDAAASTVNFYLSTDAIFDSNDINLGSDSLTALGSNITTTRDVSLAIGSTILPGTYYLFAQADSNGVLSESDENNNLTSKTLQVKEDAKADLSIKELVTSPQVIRGSNLVVGYTVQNLGNADAGTSTTKFYLSADTILDSNDLYLGSDGVAAIAPVGESPEDVSLAISNSINTGTYYLFAQTDGENLVAESNENNNLSYQMISVGESGIPDLAIAPLGVTVNGLNLAVSYTIKNQGSAATVASNTKFYLSTDNKIETTDTLLGSDAVAALGADASSVETFSVKLANNLTAGTYYLLAQADSDGAIAESDESNNIASSSLALKSDLTVTGLSFYGGTNKITRGIGFNPVYTLQNLGNAKAPASAVKYTLSKDAILGNADDVAFTYLSNAGLDAELAAGLTRTEKNDALIIYTNEPGMYTCFMQTDSTNTIGESNENNNVASVNFELVIAPKPDLTITKLDSPNKANVGGHLNLSYRIHNIDKGYIGFTQVGFYLSKDGVVDSSDINLGYHTATSDTPSNGTINRNWSLLLDSSKVTTGNYNLIAVIDPLDDTKETNETNNTIMRSITIESLLLPDVSANYTGSTTLETGKYLTLPYSISNTGSAIKSSTTEFYISKDAVYDNFDLRLGSHQIDSMTGGETRSETASIYFNPTYASLGTNPYYLIVKADGGGGTFVSAESNETNNLKIIPITVVNSGTTEYSSTTGYGLINAAAAVAAARGEAIYADVANVNKNWGIDLMKAPEVWAKGYTGQGITVAVIDTGVDYTHPDLKDNIWVNTDEIAGNGIDDDDNGYIDDVRGWNFADNNNDPKDSGTHGTHVAGIIAASNNSIGYTGVAYNAKIMPLRVYDNGDVWGSINNAIRYAVDNGARVVNMSLGGSTSDPDGRLKEVLRYASERGVIVVSAAGNYGDPNPLQPGAFADRWGLVVGATGSTGSQAGYSNKAGIRAEMAYVLAPGSASQTVPGGGYAGKSGTSMASPHVAGLVALMLSANPNLTDAQVREIVTGTAGPITVAPSDLPTDETTAPVVPSDPTLPTLAVLPDLNS